MSKRLALIVAVVVVFLSSAGIVTFLSAQDGGTAPISPAGPSQTPPLETTFAPDRVIRSGSTTVWRISRDEGILFSSDSGQTWAPRNAGLPMRAVYPFTDLKPPIITGLAADPYNTQRVGITTLDSLYLSEDAGVTWERIDLKDPLRANDQLTCVALAPLNDDVLAIGTSFHGFFETMDRGKTWTSLSEPLAPLQLGGGTYQEIASLAYDPDDPSLIWFNLGFGKGLYSYRRGSTTVTQIPLPQDVSAVPVRDISFQRVQIGAPWELETKSDHARWAYARADGSWRLVERIQPEDAVPDAKLARLKAASDKYGIYVSSYWASGDRLQRHLAFLKAQGLNSLVVDCKEDNGYVTYNTQLEAPQQIGAVSKRFDADQLVKIAHANGLYLIGRIVTFRDKQLYNAFNYKYAAWDAKANAPWRYLKKTVDEETGEETQYQGEYWVDPYSEYVWDYNIDIARELQAKGFDEIQFDYIRFPSDGDVGGITWRYRRPDMGKLEALESFLAKARQALVIPISTDVYGYAGWARISNWVAQNIEMYSRYVDVIQPMFYPSHFPRDFLGSMDYLPRARYIYEEGTRRSAYIVEGRSIIRPYVQAFRLGGELNFSASVYSTYLTNQVQGSLLGAGSGFTLWNASNDYYMVTSPLGPLISHTLSGEIGG